MSRATPTLDEPPRNLPVNAPANRPSLRLPDGHDRLLLHSCCAPAPAK